MSIRFALEKDLAQIKDLLFQVNNVHAEGRPDIFIKDATKYQDKDIINKLHNEKNVIFAYTDEADKMVAYAFCEVKEYGSFTNMQPIKTLYIDDLCVDAKNRHHHIGEALFNHVKSWAINNGFYNLELNVWECNPNAKKFYEKMGMKVLKTGLEIKLS